MIVNKNVTGIGIRRTTEGRARVVYTSLSFANERDAYDGDFPIDEAREIMQRYRDELAASQGQIPGLYAGKIFPDSS